MRRLYVGFDKRCFFAIGDSDNIGLEVEDTGSQIFDCVGGH